MEDNIHKAFQSTISTAFYHNHVKQIRTRKEAYELAKEDPETIITDIAVHYTQELGLPEDAKVLVRNDGAIVGRTAKARVIVAGSKHIKELKLLQDCIAYNHKRSFYKTDLHVGLDQKFTTNVKLMIPSTHINNLYNSLINFEIGRVKAAKGEIYLYVDPDWHHEHYPDGLVLLDPVTNVGAVLGLRYFGEIKKGILSLAWNMAKKEGFIPCHGGLKYLRYGKREATMAVFGLSGSGKSTITFAKPQHADEVWVLHDDAFVIDRDSLETIALEPSYFDKTADYPMGHEAIESFVTVQNNGVRLDEEGKLVLVTEDIRNGNGRTIKSRYVQDNRVDFMKHPLNSIFWIMRDEAFPPCVKITDPVLAAVMGASITTTRSNAENTQDVGKLVIEPYANPFRLYPLAEDYTQFKQLFAKKGVACYILNTGYFNGIKVTPQATLAAIEAIVKNDAEFAGFGELNNLLVLKQDEYIPDFKDSSYIEKLRKTFMFREEFLNTDDSWTKLPQEALDSVEKLLDTLESIQ